MKRLASEFVSASRSHGGIGAGLAALAVGLLAAAAPVTAKAAPLDWRVHAQAPSYLDRDEDGSIDAIKLTYLVSNTSAPGDANNLVSFTVNAGSNQGVYNAAAPDGWLVSISDTRTIFTGNGGFIAPNGGGTFHLYGDVPHFTQGTASAVSLDNGPFDNQNVLVPASEPPVCVLALARAGGVAAEGSTNKVTLSVTSTNLPAFRILQRASLSSGDWTPLGTYAVTGGVTQVIDTNSVPTRFYQAVSP